MTAHGFRSMASTLLNEQGWNSDAIEHGEGNGARAAYNYAQHLPERKRMMTAWADYLDGLASGASNSRPNNKTQQNCSCHGLWSKVVTDNLPCNVTSFYRRHAKSSFSNAFFP